MGISINHYNAMSFSFTFTLHAGNTPGEKGEEALLEGHLDSTEEGTKLISNIKCCYDVTSVASHQTISTGI